MHAAGVGDYKVRAPPLERTLGNRDPVFPCGSAAEVDWAPSSGMSQHTSLRLLMDGAVGGFFVKEASPLLPCAEQPNQALKFLGLTKTLLTTLAALLGGAG